MIKQIIIECPKCHVRVEPQSRDLELDHQEWYTKTDYILFFHCSECNQDSEINLKPYDLLNELKPES